MYWSSFKSNAFAEISGPNKLSQKKFKLILVWRPNVLVLSPVFIGMNIAPKHCNFYAVVHWKVRKGIQKISPNRDMQDPNKFALCKSWLALLFEKIALIQVSHYTNPDSTRTYRYKKNCKHYAGQKLCRYFPNKNISRGSYFNPKILILFTVPNRISSKVALNELRSPKTTNFSF